MPKNKQKGKIRAICEYCLYYKETEPNVGVVKTNFGIEGNEKKVKEWIRGHKKTCDGKIIVEKIRGRKK